MSPPSSGKFKNLSSEEREFLEALESSGELVEDLMEGASRDPSPAPSTPKTKKIKLTNKIKEQLFLEFKEKLLAERQVGGDGVEGTPRPSGQVRATPPSLFSGKRGSFCYFARKLEGYAKLTNVPAGKWVALGVQLMEERPTKVWDTHVRKLEKEGIHEHTLEWKDFKTFMVKRYDSTDTVAIARAKLDKVFQGNETVERYIERFMSLLADVEVDYQIAMQDQLHLFTKGLNTPLKLACTVNPATGSPFTDLEDICTYVVKYEASLKSTYVDAQGPKRKRVYTQTPQVAAGVVEQQPPAPPSLGLVGAPPFGSGRKIDSRTSIPKDRECYFCHKLGHESWQCVAKKQYLAAKAQASGHTPSNFQPGFYPRQGNNQPVAAPLQGVSPPSHIGPKGFNKGKRWKGKGKGKGPKQD
jgi:hypothetical protein